jgi:hypothetical protein
VVSKCADLEDSLIGSVRTLMPATAQSADSTRFASVLSTLLCSSKSRTHCNPNVDSDGLLSSSVVAWPACVCIRDAKHVAYALVISAAKAAVACDKAMLVRRLVELQQFIALEAAASTVAALLAVAALAEVPSGSIPMLELGSGDASESECTSPRRRVVAATATAAPARLSIAGARGDIISDDSYASTMSVCGTSGGVSTFAAPATAPCVTAVGSSSHAQIEEVLHGVSAALDDSLAMDFAGGCKGSKGTAMLAGGAAATNLSAALVAARAAVDGIRLGGLTEAVAAEVRNAGVSIVVLPAAPPAMLSAALRPRMHTITASTPSARGALSVQGSSSSCAPPSHATAVLCDETG